MILGQEMCLLPEKALFWPSKDMLIIADLHLGKAGHFRKSGIPIPSAIHLHDLDLLTSLLHQTHACHLLFLGDLFHSTPNHEWLQFEQWLQSWLNKNPTHRATLAMGNHDIHGEKQLPSCLSICAQYEEEGIVFSHEPVHPSSILPHQYNLSGHLHPAVNLRLRGRSAVKLPCFYLGKKQGILPAFGQFNGHLSMPINTQTDIFMVVEGKVLKYG